MPATDRSAHPTLGTSRSGPATPHRAFSRRLLAAHLTPNCLSERGRKAVTLTRAGHFHDPRYGDFEISLQALHEMVRNFEARTYGQDIFIDVAHRPEDGAAGQIHRLWVEGDRLLAQVEWTPYGQQAIRERSYRYLSAEYIDNWIDNEQRQPHGAVLFGAALTIRPAIKRLDPIQLSEPTGLHTALAARFTQEAQATMKKHLDALRKRLAELKLDAKAIDQLAKVFEDTTKTLGEDETALQALVDALVENGKTLVETLGDRPVTIQLTLPPPAPAPAPANPATPPPPKALSEDDIKRILAEEQQRQTQAAQASAKTLADLKSKFRARIENAEGLKQLSDADRAKLLAAESLIFSGMSEEQVLALADNQISIGDQMAVHQQLRALGWQGHMAGSTHIQLGADHAPRRLQEAIDKRLHESLPYSNHRLRLTEEAKLSPSVRRVLALFDERHGAQLDAEARILADGGATSVSNMNVPAGFQRTVIRESLSDLAILDLVQMMTDPIAQATTQIPYETRLPGTIVNDGVVYEGAGIPRASIQQSMDTAYINAMKLSLRVSNEAMHFSAASLIDWDAYGRNVESNSRLMRELVCRRIANELQRSADAYAATAVTGESLTTLLDGSESLIKTVHFPLGVCRT